MTTLRRYNNSNGSILRLVVVCAVCLISAAAEFRLETDPDGNVWAIGTTNDGDTATPIMYPCSRTTTAWVCHRDDGSLLDVTGDIAVDVDLDNSPVSPPTNANIFRGETTTSNDESSSSDRNAIDERDRKRTMGWVVISIVTSLVVLCFGLRCKYERKPSSSAGAVEPSTSKDEDDTDTAEDEEAPAAADATTNTRQAADDGVVDSNNKE